MSLEDSNFQKFADFQLRDVILKGVEEAGFQQPSPIQQLAIPKVLEGTDIIAQAHTGTGKTAAFGLPCLNRITASGKVELLVLTPTRELAMQVSDELFKLGRYADIHTTAVYGGSSYARQIDQIKRGVSVVVATPGRFLDLLRSGRIGKLQPSMVVLDEADEMLDMGFLEDIQQIFSFLSDERQTLMFSATMPAPIRKLADKILRNPVHVKVESKETVNTDIEQRYYVIEERERNAAVIRLIDSQEPAKAIIFCRTKREVDELSTSLTAQGYPAYSLHGDMEQNKRREIMTGFRAGKISILVATDVAARGLDISDVSHVFNYHIPFDPESYVHRIGRTGRAGRKGIAITLVTPIEFRQLQRIQHLVGGSIQLCSIPTIHDLRKNQVNKLIDIIRNQPLIENASEILTALEEEMDLQHLAYKLVSVLLERDTIAGPDIIGPQGKDLQRLQERLSNRGKSDRGGRGDRRPGKERHFHKREGSFKKRFGDKEKGSEKGSGERFSERGSDKKFGKPKFKGEKSFGFKGEKSFGKGRKFD